MTTPEFRTKGQKFWDEMDQDSKKLEKIAGTVVSSVFSLNQELNELSSTHEGNRAKAVAQIGAKADLWHQMSKAGSSMLRKMIPESVESKAGELANNVTNSMKNILEKMGFTTVEEDANTGVALGLGEIFAKNMTAALASLTSDATADAMIETMAAAGAALDSVAPFLIAAQLIGLALDLWNPCGFTDVIYQDNLDQMQFMMKVKLNGYITEKIASKGGSGFAPIKEYPKYQPLTSTDKKIQTQLGNLVKKCFKDNNYDPSKREKVDFPFDEIFIQIYTTVVSEIQLALPSYIKALKEKYKNDDIFSSANSKAKWNIIGYISLMAISILTALTLSYFLITTTFDSNILKGTTILFTIIFYIIFILLIYFKYGGK